MIGFANAQADKLLDKAEVEYDRKKRIQLLRKVYRIASEEQSQIFLFSGEYEFYGRSARLKMPAKIPPYGFTPNSWWIQE